MSRVHLRRTRALERTLQTLTEIERQRKIMAKAEPPADPHAQNDYLRFALKNEYRSLIGSICVLSLCGDPKIDEPLDLAWQRSKDSAMWKAVRARYPHFGRNNRDDEGHPCTGTGARCIGNFFFDYMLPDLSGEAVTKKPETELLTEDEVEAERIRTEQIEAETIGPILAQSPLWLLWYAHADLYIEAFGLKSIDLSRMQGYPRDPITFRMSCLPEGPFELRPLPTGRVSGEYKGITLPKGHSPRDRKRFIKNLDEQGDNDEPMSLQDRLDARKEALRRKYGC